MQERECDYCASEGLAGSVAVYVVTGDEMAPEGATFYGCETCAREAGAEGANIAPMRPARAAAARGRCEDAPCCGCCA